MAGFEPFATPEDYTARYGQVDSETGTRLAVLLSDASAIILRKMGGAWEPGADEAFDAVAASVACSMAHRCLTAPQGMDGVTQYAQTAGSYSVNLSLSGQNLRILPSELDALGLSDGIVTSARMQAVRSDDEG